MDHYRLSSCDLLDRLLDYTDALSKWNIDWKRLCDRAYSWKLLCDRAYSFKLLCGRIYSWYRLNQVHSWYSGNESTSRTESTEEFCF